MVDGSGRCLANNVDLLCVLCRVLKAYISPQSSFHEKHSIIKGPFMIFC